MSENAVIYPRYSSAGQNDQTIEGQIRVCREYAERQGLSVIGIYDGDRAKSASKETEKRKDLHRMFADAETGAFQYIIVYKMDRFARNRNESRIFKSELAKHGVKVLSATENITDDEGGELYEMFLEWNDEKYSQRLSKRIRDGLITSLENGTYTGTSLIYGYKLVDTDRRGKKGIIHRVAVDEEQAEIVRFIFTEYANGMSKKEIVEILNARGLKYKGKPFHIRIFERWLTNVKYTGEFTRFERVWDNIYPQIVDKLTFERVRERLIRNRNFAGANKAPVTYLLTGKAYYARCYSPIISDNGTSRDGATHHYYVCKNKRKSLCAKKRSNKGSLEKGVTEFVQNCLRDPKIVNKAVDDTMRHHEQRTGDDGLRSIETRIANTTAEAEQLTNSYVTAKNDLLRATIERKMSELEKYLKDLNAQKARIKLERGLKVTKAQLLEFIAELVKGDANDKAFQKKIIDKLVYKVYIDDNSFFVLVHFFKMDKAQEVPIEELNEAVGGLMCSFSNSDCPPIATEFEPRVYLGFFFLFFS